MRCFVICRLKETGKKEPGDESDHDDDNVDDQDWSYSRERRSKFIHVFENSALSCKRVALDGASL